MRIVVTGGAGYKGTVLVEKLLQRGYEVAVIDTLWFGNYLRPHPKLEVYVEDLRTLGTDTVFQDTDCCIHLASVANDPSALLDPRLTWEVNVLGTRNLLEICKKNKVPKFVYASSGSVYGVKEELEVTEHLELNPISDYNKTKMVAERIVQSYQGDMKYTIFRPGTVCGVSPRMRLDLAVNAITYNVLTSEDKVLHIDGWSLARPHIHIKDATEAYIWAINHPQSDNQIFNLGFENMTMEELSKEIVTTIQCYTNKQIQVLGNVGSNDARNYRLCSKKLMDAGFKPRRVVAEGISDVVEAYLYNGLRKTDQNVTVDWMRKCAIR